MKASLFTLLPLACFMQSALAAPAVAEKDTRAIVGSPVKSTELADRGLLDGLLGTGSSSGSDDITGIPALGQLSVLVTTVVGLVQDIDNLIAGSSGNVTNLVPGLTDQLGQLESALSGVDGIVSSLTGLKLDVTQIGGLSSLLARLYNAIGTLVAQLSTVTASEAPALSPVTRLLSQILTALSPLTNLNILNLL